MARTKLEDVAGLGFDPRFGQLDTRGMPGIEEQGEETFVDDRFTKPHSRFSADQILGSSPQEHLALAR
jgi:hypothetical protein